MNESNHSFYEKGNLVMTQIINDPAIEHLTKTEEVFLHIVRTYGLPASWSRPTGFVSLVQIILEQQVSLNSAKATFLKLNNGLGEVTPKSVSSCKVEELRSFGVSRPKAHYIQGLALNVINGDIDIEGLSDRSYAEVFEELVRIKGIGPWTAQIYLMFALQSPDIYPPGDIALINTILELWPNIGRSHISSKTLEWSPYRSTACYLLWHYYLKKRGRAHPDDL